MSKFIAARWIRLKAAGLFSSGEGVGGPGIEVGPGAIVVSTLLGAFLGLIIGLVVSQVFRFLAMTCNRSFGGYSWVIYGALIGAVTCALLAISNEKN
jgi:hypothetical protein